MERAAASFDLDKPMSRRLTCRLLLIDSIFVVVPPSPKDGVAISSLDVATKTFAIILASIRPDKKCSISQCLRVK